MLSKPIVGVLVLGAMVATGTGQARAATPSHAPGSAEPLTSAERPLTTGELRLSNAKVAAAETFVQRLRQAGFGLNSLDCVPNIAPQADADAAPAAGPANEATADASCAPPSGFLPVEARQQAKSYYCGPAVGQVISNYAWAMATGKNKFSQATIAGWMKTDINGLTNAPELAAGLNRATAGSPRHKPGFSWGITDLRDLNGSGSTSDELQTYLVSAISSVRMPVAIAVKPHDPGSVYNLASWPNPIRTSGHWISAYGWVGTGGTSAKTYYTDSSGAQGGGTGKYWNLTSVIANLIDEHTRRIVW
jgi:hypothetical protein